MLINQEENEYVEDIVQKQCFIQRYPKNDIVQSLNFRMSFRNKDVIVVLLFPTIHLLITPSCSTTQTWDQFILPLSANLPTQIQHEMESKFSGSTNH